MNDLFVEKASYIIKKRLGGETKEVPKKGWANNIAPGHWFSFTNYLQVKEFNAQRVTVKNQR